MRVFLPILAGLSVLGGVVAFVTRKQAPEIDSVVRPLTNASIRRAPPNANWIDDPAYPALGTVSEDWIKNALRR